jgi:AcrR family transcriptional regulator
MPRKETITKGMVLDAALAIAKKEGLEGLTARSIAKKLKCSTIPIYSQFRSMGDLEEEVLVTASSFLLEYTKRPYSPHPFLNMGIGMVLFSRDNPKLFNELFSGRGKAKQIVGGVRTEFRRGLLEAEDFKRFPPEHVEEMLDLTMVFTMGLAGMASSGLLDDVTEGHIISMLDEAGDAVINHSIRKALGMDASAGAVFREYQLLEGHAKKGGKAK